MSLMFNLSQQALAKGVPAMLLNPGMFSAGTIRLVQLRGLSSMKRVVTKQRNKLLLGGMGFGFTNQDGDNKREYHNRSSNNFQPNRWYENQNRQSPFDQSQSYYHHHRHHRSCGGAPTKLKVIGSVALGVYVLHAVPSAILLMAGGALGAIGYRWANLSKFYEKRDTSSFNNSPFPFMFQFPDTSSILKNPRQFGRLMTDPPQPHGQDQAPPESYQPPSVHSLGWAIVNQVYPKVAQRAHAMHQATHQLRTQAITLLQSQFNLDTNKILSLLPSSSSPGTHTVDDLLVEPHNEVLYQAPDHKIELELRIVMNNTNLLAKVHGRVEFDPPSSSSSSTSNQFEHPDFGVGDVVLTYVEVTNIKTWKSVTIQP